MNKQITTLIITLLFITAVFAQSINLVTEIGGYYTEFRELAGNSQNVFIATQGTTGLLVLDVSDIGNPYPVGVLENIGQLNGGLALNGNFVYLCSFFGNMMVIDVSDPANPQLISSCQVQTFIHEIFYYEGFCYLTCDSTIKIVDVSNPREPQIVSTIVPTGMWPRSTVVYNDLAYITSMTGMFIYDVSDPENPVQLGFFPADDVFYIDVLGDYAVIETFMQDSLLVIDVSNPYAPVEVGSFYLGEDEVCNHIRANGNYLYVALGTIGPSMYEHGILILDMSDPANPALVGNFGEQFSYLFFYDDYLYTRSGNKGFRAYDISNPIEPQVVGNCMRMCPNITLISGDYAFVLNMNLGVQALDISDIYNPVETDFYYSPGTAWDFTLNGNLIYLADDEGGLRVLDISDPSNLTEAGSYYYPGIEYDYVELEDNYAIVTGDRSLVILDVSNLDSIYEVNSVTLETGSSEWLLKLMGDYAVLAIGDSVKVLDISDPLHISLVGRCEMSAYQDAMELGGYHAYISHFSPPCGLSIVNLENPFAPFEECFLLEGTILTDVAVDGDYCYLACYLNSTFRIYDLSDFASPVEIGSYNTSTIGRSVTLYDTLVFFGTDDKMYIFDCSDYVSVGKSPELTNPTKFELLPPYPNPFNQSATITFTLPEAGEVELKVYDIIGREVQDLGFGIWDLGTHSVVWDTKGCASGVYFVRMEAGEYKQTQKIALVK